MGISQGGSGSRGGGVKLRTPPDIFSGANRNAAETARNNGLNAAALVEFNADPDLAIILRISGTDTYQVRRGGAWRDITNVVRGPTGPGASDAQVQSQVQTGVKPYARTGGPVVPDGEITADVARDAEVAAAIATLRGGVASAYDTLAELAAKVVTGVVVSSGRIILSHFDGTNTSADATSLARTDAQINALIQAALSAGQITVAQVLAAILAGTNVIIDRSSPNEITISASSSGPAQNQHIRAGWSSDQNIANAELSASSATDTVRLPSASGLNYLAFWRSDADGGDPTEVHLAGGGNSRNLFGSASDHAFGGVAGKLIVSAARQNADLLGGENARLV